MPPRKVITDIVERAKNNSFANHLFRYRSKHYERARELIREIRDSPAAADHITSLLLERALTWAKQTSYGKHFSSRLGDWPILTKPALQSHPNRFRRRWHFSIPASTGGSSGQPLRLWRSLECIAAEQAIVDSLLGDDSPPMSELRVAVLRADYVKNPADVSPPFGVWRNNGRWLVLSSAHLSRTNLPWFVDQLSAMRPDVLWVYPTALSNLLYLTSELGVKLNIPTVLSSSEMMSAALFENTRRLLNARVIDRYGHGERVCSAHCDTQREYRFDRAYGHVELIPDTDSRSDHLGNTARIIATGYWNSALPLVRYDTGDRVLLPDSWDAHSLQQIAKGERPFLGVVGRADDFVVGRGGEKITGMNHIPRELDAVLRMQIIQESTEKVRILALSSGPLTDRDHRTLLHNARELLPPYMDIQIESVEQLESLANGKTPFILRNLSSEGSALSDQFA